MLFSQFPLAKEIAGLGCPTPKVKVHLDELPYVKNTPTLLSLSNLPLTFVCPLRTKSALPLRYVA